MSSTMSFERAKAALSEDQGGTSVYEHLVKVVMDLNKKRPKDAKATFEEGCTAIKRSSFTHKPAGIPFDKVPPAVAKHQQGWAQSTLPLVTAAAPSNWQIAQLLEYAGVGIGRENNFLLNKRMDELATEANDVRFWGKICGTKSDYFVVEGTLKKPSAEGLDGTKMEIPGKPGANQKAYWVCSCPGGAFAKLPHAQSEYLKLAPKIKKYFSGDLSKTVYSYPPFDGTEADLLRAQIAQISSDCSLVPADMYAPSEGDDGEPDFGIQLIEEEELLGLEKSGEDLLTAEGWQHAELEIRADDGRCVPLPLPEDSEEEAPEVKPPLRPANEDQEDEEKPPVWRTRAVKGGSIAVIKNQVWPGAVTVGVPGGGEGNAIVQFANIYA